MARSHAPFSVLPAYQDDLALAIIASVATQARHQAATRDLLEVKAIPTGTFRELEGSVSTHVFHIICHVP
jgi:hypothetical protein